MIKAKESSQLSITIFTDYVPKDFFFRMHSVLTMIQLLLLTPHWLKQTIIKFWLKDLMFYHFKTCYHSLLLHVIDAHEMKGVY